MPLLEEVFNNVDFVVKNILESSEYLMLSYHEYYNVNLSISLEDFMRELPDLERALGREVSWFGLGVGINVYECLNNMFAGPGNFCYSIWERPRGPYYCNRYNTSWHVKFYNPKVGTDYTVPRSYRINGTFHITPNDTSQLRVDSNVKYIETFWMTPWAYEREFRENMYKLPNSKRVTIYFKYMSRDDPDGTVCHNGTFCFIKATKKVVEEVKQRKLSSGR